MRQGFSLMELSIVLVIIGLLVGGVMVGGEMKRNADLTSMLKDVSALQSQIEVFKTRYSYLPGDFPEATMFWPQIAGACPLASDTDYRKTCNGDGTGKVDTSAEMFRMWQHMANAELIRGQYSGVTGPGGATHMQIGVNIPQTSIPGVGISLIGGTGYVGASYFSTMSNHSLLVGIGTATSINDTPFLTPREALSIDTKIDDGKPGSGKIITYTFAGNANCATTNVVDTAIYSKTFDGRACILHLTGIR